MNLYFNSTNENYYANLFLRLSLCYSHQSFYDMVAEFKQKNILQASQTMPDIRYEDALSYIEHYAKKDRHYPRIGEADYCSHFFIQQLDEKGYLSSPENLLVVLRHFYLHKESLDLLCAKSYFRENIVDNIKAIFDERTIDKRYYFNHKVEHKKKKTYFLLTMKNSGSDLINDNLSADSIKKIFTFLSKNTYTQNLEFVKNFQYNIESSKKDLEYIVSKLFTTYRPKKADNVLIEKTLSSFSSQEVSTEMISFIIKCTDAYSSPEINPYIVPYLFKNGIVENMINYMPVFQLATAQLSNKDLMQMYESISNNNKKELFYKLIFNNIHPGNINYDMLYQRDEKFLQNDNFKKHGIPDLYAHFLQSFINMAIDLHENQKKINYPVMQAFNGFFSSLSDKTENIVRNTLIGFTRKNSTQKEMDLIEQHFNRLCEVMLSKFAIDLSQQHIGKYIDPTLFTRSYETTFHTWIENKILKKEMESLNSQPNTPLQRL